MAENRKRSKEWSLSAELIKRCRRRMVAIVLLSVGWVATVIGFTLYICL